MSFKKFSSAQDTLGKNKPEDKQKNAAATDQPAGGAEKAPSESAPTPKS